MKTLFDKNGLVFWSEEEIILREYFEKLITSELKNCLLKMNSAFQIVKCEAPLLIPKELIHENYTKDDVFFQDEDDLALRPETTASSYLYAEHILNAHEQLHFRLPLVVYQHQKSFRKEQDKTLANMRLKEFYQLEYQILFSDSTKNDYYPQILECINNVITKYVDNSHTELSDRLPVYSEITTDVVMDKNNMEVCSISKRSDYPKPNIKVIEVAIGTCRLIYNKK